MLKTNFSFMGHARKRITNSIVNQMTQMYSMILNANLAWSEESIESYDWHIMSIIDRSCIEYENIAYILYKFKTRLDKIKEKMALILDNLETVLLRNRP